MPSITEIQFYLKSARTPPESGWDLYVEVYPASSYLAHPDHGGLLGTSTVDVGTLTPGIGQWVSFTFSPAIDFTNSGFYGFVLKTTAPSDYARAGVEWHQATDGKNPVNYPEDTDTETFWNYDAWWGPLTQIMYKVYVDGVSTNWAVTGRTSPGTFETWYEAFSDLYLGIRSYLVGETGSGPTKPKTPTPANAATAVNFSNLTLSWVDGGGTDTYDIYIGPTGGMALMSFGQATTSYITNLAELETVFDATPINQVIYWRVDASNENGTTTGDTWNFDARPAAPTTPSPVNGATAVSVCPALSWAASALAVSYSLLTGPSSGSLASLVTGVAEVSYSVEADVYDYVTTYNWRVDATNQFGATTGTVWTFTSLRFDPPHVTYYYNSGTPATSFYYFLLTQPDGTLGSPPPTGVENTDYEILTGYLPNFINTNKKLIALAKCGLYYQN